MKFMALIYGSEAIGDDVDLATLLNQYERFDEDAGAAGVLYGEGAALKPVSTATSVKLRDGKSVITDGPFAETKEQLGGYYIFDCKDLNEALEWAAKIPSARYGTVEVRPVMEFDE
jgi:hypothetical protein